MASNNFFSFGLFAIFIAGSFSLEALSAPEGGKGIKGGVNSETANTSGFVGGNPHLNPSKRKKTKLVKPLEREKKWGGPNCREIYPNRKHSPSPCWELMQDEKVWTGPDFMIIGAAKCGTTSLYKYLAEHPLLIPSLGKEVNFFSIKKKYLYGVDWYRKQFPARTNPLELIYEASPGYILNPDAPERVYKHFPKTKIIMLLREPVARIWSEYKYFTRIGREDRSFRQVLKEEFADLDKRIVKPMANGQKEYLVRGIYLPQIKRWRKYFPKEQILIVPASDLFDRSEETVNKIFKFIGMKEFSLKEYPQNEPEGIVHPDLDEDLHTFLKNLYAPYNEELIQYMREEYDVEFHF